jgi:hypothetical protein
MDHLITYDKAAGFFKNPPSLALHPDFTKIWALCKHITQVLKLLECPQSMLHGWTGPTIDLTMYALLNPTPFLAPLDPGDVLVYLSSATLAAIKTVDRLCKNAKKYFMLYVNISSALFRMLDENIDDSFKVSNDPTLTG